MQGKKFFPLFIVCCIYVLWFQSSNALARQWPENTMSAAQVLTHLKENNAQVMRAERNFADISTQRKLITTKEGQKPYAVVIACADSRVAPEHIFAAGIGELFVIRNAGNIIGKHELASLEYAVKHLPVRLVLVLGHTHCGAVKAAIACACAEENKTELQDMVHHIHKGLRGETQARKAEIVNVENSLQAILAYAQLKEVMQKNKVLLKGGLYNIGSGAVEFFPVAQEK